MAGCIFHIDLDAFFASVEQALSPELRGKPVIVGGDPSRRGVVASASYEARPYGVRAGMPLGLARRLCPQAIFLAGRSTHYQEASVRFMLLLAGLTPDLEPVGIDEAFLDLTGFEPLYGPPRETARRLKARVREELGLTASIGIAICKVVAKVASDLSKPDGLLEVPPGEERAFLAPLPLSHLPCLGPRAGEVLRGLGLSTIGEVAALPSSLLHRLFGQQGMTIHRYARGIDESPVQFPLAAVKSISRSTTFPEDTLDMVFLRAVLRYLSERVGAALRREVKGARCVSLKLRYSDFETITRSSTLKRPLESDEAIFEEGQRLLEKALEQRCRLVRLLGVGVSQLVPRGRQLNFLDPGEERKARLSETVDLLRAKYGFPSLQTGRTLWLRKVFPPDPDGYLLPTPSLTL